MRLKPAPDGMQETRFPVDPWKLVETQYSSKDLGHMETIFAVANGYLGMRANPEEGREAYTHGTYLNGLHETWDIVYPEDYEGFAKTGQSLVNAPDAKLIKLYVDDEPLTLDTADFDSYARSINFKSGILTRELLWRTPSGKQVKVVSKRMASVTHRHLALMTFEVTLLDASAPVLISSQILNRQDGGDVYHASSKAQGEAVDNRKGIAHTGRIFNPEEQRHNDTEAVLGYRVNRSRMTLACGFRHEIETEADVKIRYDVKPDAAKAVFTAYAKPNQTIKLTKFVAYHTSTGVPSKELADRCTRTLERAQKLGASKIFAEQKEWYSNYWAKSDIKIVGDDKAQQAIRWNLFQLAQASACSNEQGIAAKGVTANGYDGHYFWDTEIYLVPFLCYTEPKTARKLLGLRSKMLDHARDRAKAVGQKGALFPWRTINGEEASAYYASGTAQYHINAAVTYALYRYVQATGDEDFLMNVGAEILAETARLWFDLGFYPDDDRRSFQIHKVTGPDEYSTVVNNNMYTNTMAKFNLDFAVETIRMLEKEHPEKHASLVAKIALKPSELDDWKQAADSMFIPFDKERGVHLQDDAFMLLKPWPWDEIKEDKYPLCNNMHPLFIYRHQVLKQPDVVMAMYLLSDSFSDEQIEKNYDFYEQHNANDSSLSACIQSAVAARLSKQKVAINYFYNALYLDLCNLKNTDDGVHIASTGGVWASIVTGFAGMTDSPEGLEFRPNLPADWQGLSFNLQYKEASLHVSLEQEKLTVSVTEGSGVSLRDGDKRITVDSQKPYVYTKKK